MRIKLAILEKDVRYLNRIVSVFNTKYSDKFQISSFTDPHVAMETLANTKIDVLIADEVFDLDFSLIPKRCGFAYFVDSNDIYTYNDKRAICKFQKAELIYKQILSIYSETAGNVSGLKFGDDSTKVIMFSSPSGGVGTSTMAAACSLYFARKEKKVLYLNLEKYGSADSFFTGEGQFTMRDIVYCLRAKKGSLALKLESCVKKDERGVSFFSQTPYALDMLEMTNEDAKRLISELKIGGTYDYIIVDLDYSVAQDALEVYKQGHALVMVGDGSEISNAKIFRALQAMQMKDDKSDSPISSRVCMLYNKFSNKTGKALENIEVKNIGGAPRFEHATTAQVLAGLEKMDMFSKIV